MKWFTRMPFMFFSVATSLGLLLRCHFIVPQDWVRYPFWLHAHSHIMFLGWMLNFLTIAVVINHIRAGKQRKFIILQAIIQFLLAGMLISFPLQGYGVVSIALSTVHTITLIIFIVCFFGQNRSEKFNAAFWLAKLSLIFFVVSSIGPLLLGPLMANGYAYTKWYYFAVYYYLHFQYNGMFTFGIASLFFSLLQQQGEEFSRKQVKRFGVVLFVSVFPAYLLSTLWARPPLLFNIFGFTGILLHASALLMLYQIMKRVPRAIWSRYPASVQALLKVSLSALALKTMLQLASAFPWVARVAYENRNYIIAYLHLVLLGMITSFLVAYAIQQRWIKDLNRPMLTMIGVGFVGMELSLIVPIPVPDRSFYQQLLLLVFSVMLWSGSLLLNRKPPAWPS